jgi:hypothetical protein
MSAAREFVCFLVSAPVIPFSVYMPIRERDVKIAIEMSKAVRGGYPESRAFAFWFITAPAKQNVQPDDVQPDLSQEVKPRSGLYFLGGLIEERECGVVCVNVDRFRSVTMFGEKDSVVDADGAVIERGDDPRHAQHYRDHAKRTPPAASRRGSP